MEGKVVGGGKRGVKSNGRGRCMVVFYGKGIEIGNLNLFIFDTLIPTNKRNLIGIDPLPSHPPLTLEDRIRYFSHKKNTFSLCTSLVNGYSVSIHNEDTF